MVGLKEDALVGVWSLGSYNEAPVCLHLVSKASFCLRVDSSGNVDTPEYSPECHFPVIG